MHMFILNHNFFFFMPIYIDLNYLFYTEIMTCIKVMVMMPIMDKVETTFH
jgi:hypothetical protein